MHQEVYTQLVKHLADRGINQWVFVAARDPKDVLRCPPDTELTQYAIRHVLRPYHKVLFGNKMRVMQRALEDCFDVAKAGLIHAHFLFTDGTLAWRMHERFGVPFVVTVRPTTDIFAFMRFRRDLLPTAVRTLRAASAVVCLTPAGSAQLLDRLPVSERKSVESKLQIVPNAIGTFWHEAPDRLDEREDSSIRLISISDMSPNKNVRTIIEATSILMRRHGAVRLTLIGGNRRRLPNSLPSWVDYMPHVADRVKLRDILRRHDVFVMPSFAETFGLVYVEALSQGLPVIFSRGQAVDGLFTEGVVASAVDPHSPRSVANAVEKLALSRRVSWRQCIYEAESFRWEIVAKRLHAVYQGSGIAKRVPREGAIQ
jgi:glycosyltransferase involved in cell wall biosynthesis